MTRGNFSRSKMTTFHKCPICGSECDRDEADVGIGIMYGPWGCVCGWSEQEEYNHAGKPAPVCNGYRIDSMGGLTQEIRK